MDAKISEIKSKFPNADVTLSRGRWQSHTETPHYIDAIFETEAEAIAAAAETDGEYHAEFKMSGVYYTVSWLNAEAE